MPFDNAIWCAFLSVVVIGTLYTVISQNLTRSVKRPLIDNLFLAFEAFCNQCGNDVMENISLASICILLRSIALIAIALYGATVTSFFAVEILRPPFKNIEEFVENGQYQFLVRDITDFINMKNMLMVITSP